MAAGPQDDGQVAGWRRRRLGVSDVTDAMMISHSTASAVGVTGTARREPAELFRQALRLASSTVELEDQPGPGPGRSSPRPLAALAITLRDGLGPGSGSDRRYHHSDRL